MKITYVGRKVEISEDLKLLIEKKLQKLDKYFKDDAVATVTLKKRRNNECMEVTISSVGTLYRSEEENSTFNNALDKVMDSIERQIRKHKTKLEKRLREGAFERKIGEPEPGLAEEYEYTIRKKSFVFKPMSVDEAILQMELLGHQFYVFCNEENGKSSVVYKRNDENYGLIEQA